MTDTNLLRSIVPTVAECPGRAHRAINADPDRESVWGEPVWCAACIDSIADALEELPALARDLWDVGHWSSDATQAVVSRQVVAIEAFGGGKIMRADLLEVLACGHRWPTRSAPDPDLLPTEAPSRRCWQCAIDDPGADGRLAPVTAAARRGPRMVGSPAGSPSYLAVDEIVTWVATTIDYLQGRLPSRFSSELDVTRQVAPGRVARASDAERARVLSTSCRLLVEWRYQLLATPHARTIGREALDLVRRARVGAGVDTPAPTPVPGVPCPSCGLMSVRRDGRNPDLLICASCGNMTTDPIDDEASPS